MPTAERLPPDLGDGDEAERCRGRIGMTLGRPVMAWTFQKFLYNLRDYTDKRFASGNQARPGLAALGVGILDDDVARGLDDARKRCSVS